MLSPVHTGDYSPTMVTENGHYSCRRQCGQFGDYSSRFRRNRRL